MIPEIDKLKRVSFSTARIVPLFSSFLFLFLKGFLKSELAVLADHFIMRKKQIFSVHSDM